MSKTTKESGKPNYEYYRFELCVGKIVLKNAHIAFEYPNAKREIEEVLMAI